LRHAGGYAEEAKSSEGKLRITAKDLGSKEGSQPGKSQSFLVKKRGGINHFLPAQGKNQCRQNPVWNLQGLVSWDLEFNWQKGSVSWDLELN
jgi:hypothetical protein